jgi:hypothetical protein
MQGKSAQQKKLKSRKAPSLILNNWVVEIQMAEWKTVDKEIWLRTFETEEGAARALDVAQKLLRYKKKRPANFPCIELVAYPELRTCISCLGWPIMGSRRPYIGKLSRLLKHLLSPLELQ